MYVFDSTANDGYELLQFDFRGDRPVPKYAEENMDYFGADTHTYQAISDKVAAAWQEATDR